MSSLVGNTLKNRYRVQKYLGGGGMADVYQVFDTQRRASMVMKVLKSDLAEDREFLRRFRCEADNLAKLQHPNIVRFYGLEEEGRLAFMLMDYIKGRTLREKISASQCPFSAQQVLAIMRPVCSALHYAHQQGIVHCNLNSINIMLDHNSKVFLTAFKIEHMVDTFTSKAMSAGTPAYMAPELIRGEDPTPQSDIYALGVVLYEMLSGGERPFKGEAAQITGSTVAKVRWEQLNLKPPSLRTVNPQALAGMDAVIQTCLSKNPKKRFSNVVDLTQTIETLLENK